MEETDVEPSEFFNQLGLLVVESRIPQQSAKGRVDGPHCPSRVGDQGSGHTCDAGTPQCKIVGLMKKQMNILWRNRIPVCIEVMLYPDCMHGARKVRNVEVSYPSNKEGGLLLEQWVIQVSIKRSPDHMVSAQALFQAVRSFLYFSQLSAWLNLTHGVSPRNVAYRISPPGEFCTSSFSQTPEWHTFPVAAMTKTMGVKVNVGSLPRLQMIPHIRCWENHAKEEDNSEVGAAGGTKSRSPSPRSAQLFSKFAHLNISNDKQAASTPKRKSLKRQVQSEPKPGTALPGHGYHQPERDHHPMASPPSCSYTLPKAGTPPTKNSTATARHTAPPANIQQWPPGFLSLAPNQVPSAQMTKSPQDECRLADRHTRPTLPLNKRGAPLPSCLPERKSPPSFLELNQHALSAPELESLSCDAGDGCSLPDTTQASAVSPKVIVTQKSPGNQVYYGQDKASWLLHNVINKDSTDSDSSSPEIDRYLQKTLSNRLDPLSPQEMETYLSSLCPQHCTRPRTRQLPTSNQGQRTKYSQGIQVDCTEAVPQSKHFHQGSDSWDEYTPLLKACKLTYEESQAPLPEPPEEVVADVVTKKARLSPVLAASVSKQSQPSSTATSASEYQDYVTQQSADDRVKFNIGENNHCANTNTCNNKHKVCQRGKSAPSSPSLVEEVMLVPPPSPVPTHTPPPPLLPEPAQSTSTTNSSVCDDTGSVYSSGSTGTILLRHKLVKSVSYPSHCNEAAGAVETNGCAQANVTGNKASNLLRSVMRKELVQQAQDNNDSPNKSLPTQIEREQFQKTLNHSTNMIFHAATGLPLQSSPAPIKKKNSNSFGYDGSLSSVRAIKNSISCVNLDGQQDGEMAENHRHGNTRFYSTSAPASTNCLLGNFEESMLNGRLEPTGVVEGFTADIGASGHFCPKHLKLPVTAFFFSLSDDNAPSPYLGHIDLDMAGKRGYHIPKKGTVQVTLFNPNKAVVKMFVVVFDLTDMPSNSQTFLRQRTLYMPVGNGPSDTPEAPIYLRYLIHLRFFSSKTGKVYLHTDIRLIFARDKFEFDSRVANYELRSFTEGPTDPKFSPKR